MKLVVDAMLGKLLDALEASRHAQNTIVVLWSDHGWQLGEKEHWRKFALWENLIRTVLMMRVPSGTLGMPEGSAAGVNCDRIVSLVDLFPTLVALCGLSARPGLEGRNLIPLLRDPGLTWDHPTITTYDFNEFSIRTEGWHYIHYIDDSEELYDLRADPEEWTNLANDPAYQRVKDRMAAMMPPDPAPVVDTSYELAPHHIPPLKSKEEYLRRRAAMDSGGG